jgi:hypothetical protein
MHLHLLQHYHSDARALLGAGTASASVYAAASPIVEVNWNFVSTDSSGGYGSNVTYSSVGRVKITLVSLQKVTASSILTR